MSWLEKKTVIVPDVEKFPGHIACSSLSKSEIVLPIIRAGQVVGVLDIDAVNLNEFDELDSIYLQQIIDLIEWKN